MMIDSVADRKKVNDALQEISNSFTRIEAERDLINNIKNDLADQFKIPKKQVNKLAKVFHKQNFPQETQEFEELEALYEEVVNLVK